MSKRYIKIEGILEIPEGEWTLDDITEDFLDLIEENCDATFNGKFVEVDEEGNEIKNKD